MSQPPCFESWFPHIEFWNDRNALLVFLIEFFDLDYLSPNSFDCKDQMSSNQRYYCQDTQRSPEESPQTCRLRTGQAQSSWSGLRRVPRTVDASEARALPSDTPRRLQFGEENWTGGRRAGAEPEQGRSGARALQAPPAPTRPSGEDRTR